MKIQEFYNIECIKLSALGRCAIDYCLIVWIVLTVLSGTQLMSDCMIFLKYRCAVY